MSTEDRLRTELRELAEQRNVDVDALYGSTRERIDRQSGARSRRPRLLVAASAAAVLGIAGGGLWAADQIGGTERSAPPADRAHLIQRPITTGGPVDSEFTCANTTTSEGWKGDTMNVAHPRLGWKGIERSQFGPNGETGTLRLGLGDGTLTAKVQLKRGQRWVVQGVEHCTGPHGSGAPVQERFELGRHGRTMPEAPKPTHMPKPTGSIVAIDDRPYYNDAGVIDHRTYYAYETNGRARVGPVFGYHDTVIEFGGSFSIDSRAPFDEGDNFLPQDIDAPFSDDFAFVVYYATEPASLTAELKDGTTVEAEQVRGDDWKGTVYAVLAPRDQVDRFVLKRGGKTKTYGVGDI